MADPTHAIVWLPAAGEPTEALTPEQAREQFRKRADAHGVYVDGVAHILLPVVSSQFVTVEREDGQRRTVTRQTCAELGVQTPYEIAREAFSQTEAEAKAAAEVRRAAYRQWAEDDAAGL